MIARVIYNKKIYFTNILGISNEGEKMTKEFSIADVDEISGEILEWDYGIQRAEEDRRKFQNKVLSMHLLIVALIPIITILIKGNVISAFINSAVFIFLYFTNQCIFEKIIENMRKEYESLMEYKRKYTFCGVAGISICSCMFGIYPDANLLLKFKDFEKDEIHFLNLHVRKKRNRKIKKPVFKISNMTLYMTRHMEKKYSL